jgi:hypothetical protein
VFAASIDFAKQNILLDVTTIVDAGAKLTSWRVTQDF